MSDDESTIIDVHPAVTTMANMINYLTVSLYQGQFTYNHEQAWARLNDIYDIISKTPSIGPSLENIQEFHGNVASLWFVTETDDPDYERYIRQLRRDIAAAEAKKIKEEEHAYWIESICVKNT
jgi:hypothetical protein